MKTKLLALALLAGGSMFAQTRFSFGINIGGNNRGSYRQAPPSYSYQVAPRYQQRGFDNRYESAYGGRASFTRGFNRNQDDNRGQGQAYRYDNNAGNRFRGR